MNWKGHLYVGIPMGILFVFIMNYFFNWYPLSISNLFFASLIIFFSPLVPDLDHESGKLKQWLVGTGLTLATIGALWLMAFDAGFFPTYEYWKILIYVGLYISGGAFFSAELSYHRGFWHSIPMGLIYGAAVGFMLTPHLGVLAFVGFYSHMIADREPFKFK